MGRERSRINGIGDCEYTLDYDALGRVTARTDGGIEKKHYDAEGYRDSITEKDKVTNFVYQGGMLLHIVEALNEQNNK